MRCSEKNDRALPWGACWPDGCHARMADLDERAGNRPPMGTDRLTDTGCGSPHTRHRGLEDLMVAPKRKTGGEACTPIIGGVHSFPTTYTMGSNSTI